MPKFVVCYKWVPNDQDVRVDAAGKIDLSAAKYVISEYDKNALEAAVQIREKDGGEVIALSFGGANLKASLKDALSRGADSVIYISDPSAATADARATAHVLAKAVATLGNVDAIICGDGSADIYSRQTAQRLASLLGWPVVDQVEKLDFADGKWLCRRQLLDEVETVEVAAPVVVSVSPGIARARIPGMKQILGAGKKPQKAMTLKDIGADAAPGAKLVSLKGATQDRKNVLIREKDADAAAAKLVAELRGAGAL